MLATTLARFGDDDYRIYVGAYPNDRATIDAVAGVAERDRARAAGHRRAAGPDDQGGLPQPACGDALLRDEAAEGWSRRGGRRSTTPRMSSIATNCASSRAARRASRSSSCRSCRWSIRGSPLVAGHYVDEFAEAHGKQLVARGGSARRCRSPASAARSTATLLDAHRGGARRRAVRRRQPDRGLRTRPAHRDARRRGSCSRGCATPTGGWSRSRAYFPDTSRSGRGRRRAG